VVHAGRELVRRGRGRQSHPDHAGPEAGAEGGGDTLLLRAGIAAFRRQGVSEGGRSLVREGAGEERPVRRRPERRQFGIGLVAAAPYGTSGFSSHDWVGFQAEPGSIPQTLDDIPGKVAALTYDFVDGGEGLDIPGLPSQVAGCMDGT
jgi:hypothetical protein